jgi:hypothetical protein
MNNSVTTITHSVSIQILRLTFKWFIIINFKVEVKSILRIGSAHNNVRTSIVKIAQISNVSNFSEHKLYSIFI